MPHRSPSTEMLMPNLRCASYFATRAGLLALPAVFFHVQSTDSLFALLMILPLAVGASFLGALALSHAIAATVQTRKLLGVGGWPPYSAKAFDGAAIGMLLLGYVSLWIFCLYSAFQFFK